MKLSKKSQYAISALIYLGLPENKDKYISVLEISQNLNFSKIYLEQVFSLLKKSEMLNSTKGIYGGYKLVKSPSEISVFDILQLTESLIFAPFDEVNLSYEKALVYLHQELDSSIITSLKAMTLDKLISKAQENDALMYYI